MNVYVLPYIVSKDNKVEIMLGFKKIWTFDGAVFNNPNQMVILGGRANKGEDKRDAAIREFREETGIALNKKDITHKYESSYYTIYYYGVREEDKHMFSKINKEDKYFDSKIVELEAIEWCSYDNAKNFMRPEKNLYYIGNKEVEDYLYYWGKNNWGYNNVTASLKKYIRNDTKFHKVINSIRKNGEYTFYYDLFFKFFTSFIDNKQSKNEWFHEMLGHM